MPRPRSGSPLARISALVLGIALVPWPPLYTVFGEGAGEQLGYAVAALGDVDGDGHDDVAAGAPFAGAGDTGSVRVFSGRDGSMLRAFAGAAPGDRLGFAVAGAGDVDGDGFADVIAGAPGDDTGGADAGSAIVFSGRDGSVLHRFADADAGDELGRSVAGAGDVNGDGYDDLIAGAPGDDTGGADAGSATVFSGRDGSVLHRFTGDDPGDAFGAAVAGAMDVDGDGFADVLVGAPLDDDNGSDAGSARVLSGRDGAQLWQFDGDVAGDQLGFAVAGTGDADGDGRADLLAGAPHASTRGTDCGLVRALSGAGGTVLYTFVGAAAGDLLGHSVARAGDLDADGRADLLAGAPGMDRNGTDAGGAVIWSGRDGAQLAAFDGAAQGDALGWSTGGGMDADGDGFADPLVGAPLDDGSGTEAGSVRVFARAPFDRLVLAAAPMPATTGAELGVEASRLGDVDRDGVPDYGAGAPFHSQLGAVWVFSGADHAVLHTFLGPSPDIFFGTEVGDAGDVDGDGHADIIIGAFHEDIVALDSGTARVYSGRTGSLLREFLGPAFRSHMGSAGGTLGDVDGDLVDDLFIGLGLHNGETGALRVYSGRTGAVLYQLDGLRPRDWFGWSAAAVGDVDGDGISDLVIGAPSPQSEPLGYAVLVSGKGGATLRTFTGSGTTDRFGWDVDAAGDVNRDGVPDVIVGADQHAPGGLTGAGQARVFSGADGALLYEILGQAANEFVGRSVSGADDVDGDGFSDFIVGAPGAREARGAALLYSGQDGSLLARIEGAVVGDALGTDVALLGDSGGDGFAEVLVGAPNDDTAGANAGALAVHATAVRADPGAFRTFAAACAGSNGWLPRVGLMGRTAVGAVLQSELRSALPGTGAALLLAATAQSIPLAALGAPGCTLVAVPLIALGSATDPAGRAGIPLAVPANPTLLGGRVYVQWLIADPGANPFGGVFSNAGSIRLGR